MNTLTWKSESHKHFAPWADKWDFAIENGWNEGVGESSYIAERRFVCTFRGVRVVLATVIFDEGGRSGSSRSSWRLVHPDGATEEGRGWIGLPPFPGAPRQSFPTKGHLLFESARSADAYLCRRLADELAA